MLRLNTHRHPLVGGGFIERLKNKVIKKVFLDRPKVITDLISDDGMQLVTKVEVCRVPVYGIFVSLLNALSLGKLKKQMLAFNYDEMFHLYVVLHLANGKSYRVEKNQRMKVSSSKLKDAETVCKEMLYGRKKLGGFLASPERDGGSNLYRYDAFKENCQDYVLRLLNSNNIYLFDNFVKQDVADLAPNIIQRLTRGITDIAGFADYVFRGGGDIDFGSLKI